MSRRVLGLWNMGEGSFHELLSPEESKAIIRRALDSQITSFDTAFSYKNADNYLASVLRERNIARENVEIITKVMAVPTLEKKFDTSLKRLK
ncbi:MAG: aldo/keto reductase, partial [Spirochaetales bacterium]|nr:aldo/keto reductase [Spirochaetales bacterium]